MRKISEAQRFNALEHFKINEKIISCQPYGNGHINDTFVVNTEGGKRYILQAINTQVFKAPLEVMSNIQKVTAHLSCIEKDSRRVMSLVYTENGRPCHTDRDGLCWRVYDFIEDSLCLDLPEVPEDFYEAAIAFGRFQRYLYDFPVGELYDTIPDFHNTPKRYNDFISAVEADICGRAKEVACEIEFIKQRKDFCSLLYKAHEKGVLPLRVTHNDTKMNNVMLDAKTRTALCVIDLDTIMPGFSVNDFGDSIRFGASTAAEDEKDLNKVWIDLRLFDIYAKGFIEGCGGLLGRDEILLMPEGAKMMTLECGMRFLTDYLQGDTYFKTSRPGHNLDRCRTQLKLVADMETKWDEMKKIVEKYI